MTEPRVGRRGVFSTAFSLALALIIGTAAISQAHTDGRRWRSGSLPVSDSHDRVWPVGGRAGGATRPSVVRNWEPPPTPWAAGHRGVDLAARQGWPVRAVADGRVSFSGKVAGRSVLSIELSETGDPPIRTTYEPVRPSVRKGEKVRAGEKVATMGGGSSHCAHSCLHWGARRDVRYLDPLSLLPAGLLRGGPSRLLPVFGVPVPQDNDASGTKLAASAGHARTAILSGSTAEARAGMRNTAATVGQFSLGGTILAIALTAAALIARRRLVGATHARPPGAPP